MHRLYVDILNQAGSPEVPLAAIVCPNVDDCHALRFDHAIQRVVKRINSILGPDYMSVQYEGQNKWTLMGSERAEWIEFNLISHKTFKVTKFLRGACFVKCSFRSNGQDMEADISNTFRMMANHNIAMKNLQKSRGSS